MPDKIETTKEATVLEEALLDHAQKKAAYNYRCNVCGSKYADQDKMVLHLIADHGITP